MTTLSRTTFPCSSVMVESDDEPSLGEKRSLGTLKTTSAGKCMSVLEYMPLIRLAVSFVCAMMTEFHPCLMKIWIHAM